MFAFYQKIPRQQRLEQGVAFLRIATGAFFLLSGWAKLSNPAFDLAVILQGYAAENPLGISRALLQEAWIPAAATLKPLVIWGELAIGAGLVVGLFVPAATLAAAVMNLNYLVATQHLGSASVGVNLAFLLIAATLFWSEAGCFYGLDYYLNNTSGKKKKRKGPGGKTPRKKASKVEKTLPKKVIVRTADFDDDDEDEDDE